MRFPCKKPARLLAALTLAALGAAAGAAPVPVTNFSFESPPQADGGFTVGSATGWTTFGTSGVFNPTVFQLPQGPTDGDQVGYSNQNGLAFTQDVAAVVIADMVYTLMVDIQSRSDGFPNQSATIELRDALTSTVLASASIGAVAPGTNATLTASFTALAGDPGLGNALRIALSAGGVQSDFDNVRLDASPAAAGNVPEPATLLLVGSALAGLGALRRRS